MNEPYETPTLTNPERTAYNWLQRVLGNRSRAKRMVRELGIGEADTDPCVLLGRVRDRLSESLAPERLARTLYGRPTQILAEIPSVAPADPEADPALLKEVFPLPVQGLLELVFVERIPPPLLAHHLGVSEDLLTGALVHVVVDLADLSEWDPPGGHLAQLVAERIRDHGATDREETPVTCPEEARLNRVFRGLSRDTRILSLGSSDLKARALKSGRVSVARREDGDWTGTAHRSRGPRKSQESQESRGSSPPDAPPSHPSTTLPSTRSLFFGGLGVALMLSCWMAWEATPPETTAASQAIVGSVSRPGRPTVALQSGEEILAGPDLLHLSFYSGLDLLLEPGARVRFTAGVVRIEEGSTEATCSWAPREGHRIHLGNLSLILQRGRVRLAGGARPHGEVVEGAIRLVHRDGETRIPAGENF